jgi:WhiB family redox-sensing transcriptional regulator
MIALEEVSTSNPNLRPILDLWEWQGRGSCRRHENSAFFINDGEKGEEKKRKEELAKRVCRDCLVKQNCRDHAMCVPERYGIWGGMTELERKRELKDSKTSLHLVAL